MDSINENNSDALEEKYLRAYVLFTFDIKLLHFSAIVFLFKLAIEALEKYVKYIRS